MPNWCSLRIGQPLGVGKPHTHLVSELVRVEKSNPPQELYLGAAKTIMYSQVISMSTKSTYKLFLIKQ